MLLSVVPAGASLGDAVLLSSVTACAKSFASAGHSTLQPTLNILAGNTAAYWNLYDSKLEGLRRDPNIREPNHWKIETDAVDEHGDETFLAEEYSEPTGKCSGPTRIEIPSEKNS